MKITAAIISRTGELSPKLKKSLEFADEILVAQDDTICDFAKKRNQVLKKAKNDWVLFVDDDEIVSTELALEIKKLDLSSTNCLGYLIPRVDLCFHYPFRHGELANIKILRLGRKDSGKFVRPVHETWEIDGRVGELKNPLYHLKNNFVSEFLPRIIQYGRIDSEILTAEGKPYNFFRLLAYPKAKFFLNYFFRLGFLDGTKGLFFAYLMSIQSLSVRVFQWQNQK